jgi:hypothetical protein
MTLPAPVNVRWQIAGGGCRDGFPGVGGRSWVQQFPYHFGTGRLLQILETQLVEKVLSSSSAPAELCDDNWRPE